ncbi:unnamed protein product [Litomosoides sigmodontis]|uniref:Serpin domain-containing protein n=1 Tax=Litomosoides sigmodontis TaxID=42156 RepID=A0A3P6TRV2_LITSI|nr:unnamed protein product [Litomosoides sigmodontis]
MDFAIKLLRYSAQTNESSLVSPSAVISALMMLYNGAEGATQREIEELFSEGGRSELWSPGDYHCTVTDFMQNLARYENSDAKQSSKLWVQDRFPILPSFKDSVTKHHNAQLEEVSFEENDFTENAANWIILGDFLFQEPSFYDVRNTVFINFGFKMFFIGKLHFQVKWKHGFFSLVEQAVFTLPSTQTIHAEASEGRCFQLPMIGRVSSFPYYEDESVQVISLPLKNNEMQMLLILPRKLLGLGEVEDSITGEKLNGYIDALSASEKTLVMIPKFAVSKYYVVSKALENMGLQSMFSKSANFSRISCAPLSVTNWIVSYATMKVDERGISTELPNHMQDISESSFRIFFANHPFLYVIFDYQKNIQWISRYVGDNPKPVT